MGVAMPNQPIHAKMPDEQLTPATLTTFQKVEIEQRWPIVRAGGIKAE
jgi:hypothetical protein